MLQSLNTSPSLYSLLPSLSFLNCSIFSLFIVLFPAKNWPNSFNNPLLKQRSLSPVNTGILLYLLLKNCSKVSPFEAETSKKPFLSPSRFCFIFSLSCKLGNPCSQFIRMQDKQWASFFSFSFSPIFISFEQTKKLRCQRVS